MRRFYLKVPNRLLFVYKFPCFVPDIKSVIYVIFNSHTLSFMIFTRLAPMSIWTFLTSLLMFLRSRVMFLTLAYTLQCIETSERPIGRNRYDWDTGCGQAMSHHTVLAISCKFSSIKNLLFHREMLMNHVSI